jgi:hypothetical protein
MDEYLKAVEIYERLCMERSDHTFWSSNLEESTVHIKQAVAWQNFYCYLNDNKHKYVNELQPSLGDAIDTNTVGDPYASDPHEYDYVTVQNGNVTVMKVMPRVDDEKLCV